MFGLWKRKPRKTTGIGYWHSVQMPNFPDPGAFVDETWDQHERARIVQYLQSGLVVAAAGGTSWCRFRCGINHVGSATLTDGIYSWPEGLAHYVDKHNVRLPHDVVKTMLSTRKMPHVDYTTEPDWAWWQSQKGWNTSITTYNDPLDMGILTILQTNRIQKLKQGDILLKYLLDLYGKKERLAIFDKILEGEEVSIKGKFKDIDTIIAEFPKTGLKAQFKRLTPDEYGRD